MPCSRRAPSTARLSTARHRLVEAPTCSASPQPAGRERARRAHAQSCSSRATACPSLEYLLWTDPPSPGCVLQALPRGGQPSATPQLPCSLTQRLRSSLQCPARSSRCCHPPPDPCHTLCQLCAPAAEVILPICGHLWAPSLSCLAPDRVARGRCAYVRLGGGNRSRPLPHCGSG